MSRRRLVSRVIEKQPWIGWYSPGTSLTRIHYELYIYHLRSLDLAQPTNSQLGSIEHPMYAHWAVLSLDPPVRHSTVPYASGRVSCFFFRITYTYRWSQRRVRTKAGSSYNWQSTPAVILWSVASYRFWGDHFFLKVSGSSPLPSILSSRSGVFYIYTLQRLSFYVHVGSCGVNHVVSC